MNGGGKVANYHLENRHNSLPTSPNPLPPPPPPPQSIEVVTQTKNQQQQLLHHHLDAINKANSMDRAVVGSCKLKRKKLQPFEPTYYFDSDFDSDGGSGGGGGGNGVRRRGSTLTCSPSFVSRFLRLSRRKSEKNSSSSSSSSKSKRKQESQEQQPLTQAQHDNTDYYHEGDHQVKKICRFFCKENQKNFSDLKKSRKIETMLMNYTFFYCQKQIG